MSRLYALKSPQTPRPRGSASSAARLRTARGGQSRSSACHGLSKRRTRPPRPKRGRNALDVRTRASAPDVRLKEAPAPVGANRSGPSEGGPPQGASDRRVRSIWRVGVGPRGQAPEGLKAARASAASTALQREVMAIVEMARRERGAPAIPRASASLTGLQAGRVPQPAKADLRDRTTRAAARPTSSQDRLAQGARRRWPQNRIRDTGSDGGQSRERKFDRPPVGRVPQQRSRSAIDTRAGRAQTSNQRRAQGRATETGRRAAFADTGGNGAPPRERRFDRPEAKRDGDRRDGPPRTRSAGDPARERKFDRPQGRTRPPAGEGRPPRSDDKSRGPRSEFKSRPPRTGARDGDRPQSRGPGGKGGPPRGRPSSPGGRPPPRKGPPKGAGGPRRPPRKP